MKWTEKQIQAAITEILEENTIREIIDDFDFIDLLLQEDNQLNFIPSFFIDFHLAYRYAQGAKRVIDSLNDYEIVSAGPGKNVSMEKGEALYPDFLLHNRKNNQWIIGELKKDSYISERMAVSQLLAYAHEVKNHLPLTADADIHLVIIAVRYNSLLRHAIAGLLLGTKYNILCLQAFAQENELKLSVYRPDSWTDVWQEELPLKAFTTVTLKVRFRRDLPAPKNSKTIMETAQELMIGRANSLDVHGFAVTTFDTSDADVYDAFCITISQLDSSVFLAQSGLETKNTHHQSILMQYLRKEAVVRTMPKTLKELADFVSTYLSDFFEVKVEQSGNWDELMNLGSTFSTFQIPVSFYSWGRIGEYHRYLFHHPSAKKRFFNAMGELEHHNHPHNGIKIIEFLRGNELFRKGRFSARDCYRFGKLIADYIHICENLLEQSLVETTKWNSRLFYQSVRLWSAVREVEYRCNSMAQPLKPAPFLLAVQDISKDIIPDIIDYCRWFQNEFLDLHIRHSILFNMAVNSNAKINRKKIEEKCSLVVVTLIDVVQVLLQEKETYQFPDKVTCLLESTWLHQDIHSKSVLDWESYIYQLPENQVISTFENEFLKLLDLIQPTVFHKLQSFYPENYNWEDSRQRLIKKNQNGEKYGVITIETNGEISTGVIDVRKRAEFKTKFGFELDPIDNPEEYVYLMLKNAGVDRFGLEKWGDIKSGKIF